jgi:RTX calcium-binding nonapeptide repeat (4 copies)
MMRTLFKRGEGVRRSPPLHEGKEKGNMRRIVMVMALVALLVAVFASAALARNFQCSERPCFGTAGDDVILERGGEGVADTIYGRAGRDVIKAQHFSDDFDKLLGGRGGDRLNSNDGDSRDVVRGGPGVDTCRIDRNDATFSCEHLIIDGVRIR